ncbi:MAG: peptide ABC transporter [Chloroflexi bacterium RBG_16_56_11]|nr:MAG: peptide ABC transporter [Chloroflexi bacterium RBG_16_56_11]
MTAYIFRRFLQALFVLLLVSIIVFLALRLLPGDPIYLLLTSEEVQIKTEEEIRVLRHENGLDRSLVIQYYTWLTGVLRGDFGTSLRFHFSVGALMLERIPLTLHLGILAFILAHLAGIVAGVICAVRRGKWLDTAVTVFANIGITVPVFWLGIMMIYLFALYLNWLPVMGYTSPFDNFWLNTRQIIMPVICLAIMPMASTTRQTRSSMLEVMHQDYIRTAWSKGLKERVIIIRHALKNGLIPVLTLAGLHLSSIIGGSVLVETVFNIPGMGRLAVYSVLNRDYQVTQGVTVIVAAAIILVNLVVDISYGWLDPRVRYR